LRAGVAALRAASTRSSSRWGVLREREWLRVRRLIPGEGERDRDGDGDRDEARLLRSGRMERGDDMAELAVLVVLTLGART